MVISKQLNLITLLPRDPAICKMFLAHFTYKLTYNVIFSIIIAFINTVILFISGILPSTEGSFFDYNNYMLGIIEVSIGLCLFILIILAWFCPFLTSTFICLTPIAFSITITEAYIPIEKFELVYARFVYKYLIGFC